MAATGQVAGSYLCLIDLGAPPRGETEQYRLREVFPPSRWSGGSNSRRQKENKDLRQELRHLFNTNGQLLALQ